MPVGVVKFAEFELDRGRYELRRGGHALKLEKIPMEILVLLVEREGQLVSRDEIIEKVWGKGVFLDTEHGINTAVRKVRQALGDDPDNPRFVQTVTGKGYRFIASTSTIPADGNGGAAAAHSAAEVPSRDASAPHATLRPSRMWRLAAGAVLAVAAIIAAVLGLNAGGLRDRLFSSSRRPQFHSLAVLPLENLSADPSQEYFADGMTDELITMLAKNPALRVVSRTSVMQYKKVHRPLPEVARELDVDGILEGSVERTGNRFHINVQLIYAPQDRHLWAESYDRDLNDLGSLQNELARTIAGQVGLTATPPAQPARSIKPEAHDAYLLGRYIWVTDPVKGREYFLKAIQLQPDYAAAHAALADSYMADMVVGGPKAEFQNAVTQAEQAARKAIALDDSDGQAHLTMAAFFLLYEWNLKEAEKESARCLELSPHNSEAHYMRANVLLALQRIDEAVQEDRKSMEIDPRIRPTVLGDALLRNRQYDAAIAELRARAEVQPEDLEIRETLATVYWQKGMFDEAVHTMASNYVPKSAAAMEAAFRRGGVRGAMEWRLAHWKEQQARGYVTPMNLAVTAARLGDRQETLRYLEQSYAERVPVLVFLQSEPDFDFLHNDPRYKAIVKKMNLPSASPRE